MRIYSAQHLKTRNTTTQFSRDTQRVLTIASVHHKPSTPSQICLHGGRLNLLTQPVFKELCLCMCSMMECLNILDNNEGLLNSITAESTWIIILCTDVLLAPFSVQHRKHSPRHSWLNFLMNQNISTISNANYNLHPNVGQGRGSFTCRFDLIMTRRVHQMGFTFRDAFCAPSTPEPRSV